MTDGTLIGVIDVPKEIGVIDEMIWYGNTESIIITANENMFSSKDNCKTFIEICGHRN